MFISAGWLNSYKQSGGSGGAPQDKYHHSAKNNITSSVMMAETGHALSSGDLCWAVVCHLRIAARFDGVGNGVPPLGSLSRNVDRCDEPTRLPPLRNVRRCCLPRSAAIFIRPRPVLCVCSGDRSHGRWWTLKWQLERFPLVACLTVVQLCRSVVEL